MKKLLMLLLLSLFSLGFSQKKKTTKTNAKTINVKETVIIYTEQEAESSSEARVIAGFLKQNPGHARTDYFKRRLFDIISSTPPAEDRSAIASNTTKKTSGSTTTKNTSSNTNTKSTTASTSNNNQSNKSKSTSNPVYASNTSSTKSTSGSKASSGPSADHKKTADMLTHIFNNDPMNNQAYLNFKNNTKCNMVVKIEGKKHYNIDVAAKNQNFALIEKGTYTISAMVCDSKYSAVKNVTKDIEIALSLD